MVEHGSLTVLLVLARLALRLLGVVFIRRSLLALDRTFASTFPMPVRRRERLVLLSVDDLPADVVD